MTQCIQLFDSKFPAVFHCQKVTDHSPCLLHFLLLNAQSKSSSRTDEIRHYDCHVKFENNTSGRARLWDTALKFLCPGLSITSPDHLVIFACLWTKTDSSSMTQKTTWPIFSYFEFLTEHVGHAIKDLFFAGAHFLASGSGEIFLRDSA